MHEKMKDVKYFIIIDEYRALWALLILQANEKNMSHDSWKTGMNKMMEIEYVANENNFNKTMMFSFHFHQIEPIRIRSSHSCERKQIGLEHLMAIRFISQSIEMLPITVFPNGNKFNGDITI